MTQPPPVPMLPYAAGTYSVDRDLNHLNLIGVFHYVFGGITMAFSSIFIVHIVIGILMINGGFASSGPNPPPPALGWLFVGLGSLAILFGWTFGILAIISGRFIRSRRHWMFSLVIAGLLCLSVPLGTVLGVFTLIVLLRDSVKSLYGLPPAPTYRPPG